jgi:hypothetical protein
MRRWSKYSKPATRPEFRREPRRPGTRSSFYANTKRLCTSEDGCAGCKHSPDLGVRCSHPDVVASSMVPGYGQVYADRILCFNQRSKFSYGYGATLCGQEGKLWEAKGA